MSARRRPNVGPSQLFKKRTVQLNTNVGSGASANQSITVRETGTVYAVKVTGSIWHDNVAGGVNRVWLSLQHRRSGAGIVALASANVADVDTVSMLLIRHGIVRADLIDQSVIHIDEKYRWRRKVDENSALTVVMENSTTQGTATSSIFSILVEVWIRVR